MSEFFNEEKATAEQILGSEQTYKSISAGL